VIGTGEAAADADLQRYGEYVAGLYKAWKPNGYGHERSISVVSNAV